MESFIKLTEENGTIIYVGTRNIETFSQTKEEVGGESCTRIVFLNSNIFVKETPQQIVEKMSPLHYPRIKNPLLGEKKIALNVFEISNAFWTHAGKGLTHGDFLKKVLEELGFKS